ncbi:YhgE/Pip domain-containing protein [Streptomyces ochraceiscleroticus]|uniref:YhgE/Pip family protein n=1 Tax=Streptomyces ochraceiscleroticus TaxID=47761 RepID=A0ABW1MEZ8_9ACTN|nr:YhgE/Pip domain-containing protein [Streptomyces ochraceiscleroticus]
MRSPKLAALELKRFGRGKLPRAALVALLLLPLLYGALYLWSFWDPYSRLDKIPVALVNTDRGASAKGEQINAGDDLVKGLEDSDTFDWHPVSAADAAKGVESGTYYLSLTVPADFSTSIASSSGDHPEAGELKVRTNDANNYIVGQISKTVFSEVRAAASAKSSRGFLDKIFVSFSDLHDATQKAADGASQLKGGIGEAKKGTGDLKDGLGTAKKGSSDLADGIDTAKKGSHDLANGLKDLDSGAGKLDTGAGQVSKGAGQVADGTQKLADKVNEANKAVGPFVHAHGKEIGDAARLVADGSQAIKDNLDRLPKAASDGATASRGLANQVAAFYKLRCESALTDRDPSCTELKDMRDKSDAAADKAEEVSGLVQNEKNLAQLGKDLDQVHRLASTLAEHGPTLGQDLDTAVKQVNDLNKGAHAVATGADKLATGAGDLHKGTGTAKKGGTDLDTGMGRLQTGAGDLDEGVGKLKNGAETLNGGMFKLSDGSAKLAGGLHDGVKQIPDYDKDQRDARTGAMSDPVQLASGSAHKAPNYGTGFAPYFIPLSLWVGAMVAYMLIQPLNRRALAAGASALRTAVSGWLPVFAIGVLQIAALMSVLHFGLGLEMVNAAGTIGFLVLATACFAAIVQWLNAQFGAAGRILVLALLMLQLTSAGGTYPVQTSPGFFNALHPYLPMTYIVGGLRRLITGGDLTPVWQGSIVLALFTVGALALTTWTARGRQVVRMKDLHPELSL